MILWTAVIVGVPFSDKACRRGGFRLCPPGGARTIDGMRGRGKRVAMWAGVLAVAVLGLAAWFSWPHLRFWWFFEPLGPNPQGYPEYRHRKTGIVFAVSGRESRVQQLIELHGQDFPDVIGAAEYDGLGVLR